MPSIFALWSKLSCQTTGFFSDILTSFNSAAPKLPGFLTPQFWSERKNYLVWLMCRSNYTIYLWLSLFRICRLPLLCLNLLLFWTVNAVRLWEPNRLLQMTECWVYKISRDLGNPMDLDKTFDKRNLDTQRVWLFNSLVANAHTDLFICLIFHLALLVYLGSKCTLHYYKWLQSTLKPSITFSRL